MNNFLRQILSEADGKGSMKRSATLWLLILISLIVLTLLSILYLTIFRAINIKAADVSLFQFIGFEVLSLLIGAMMGTLGFTMWQNNVAKKADTPPPGNAQVEQTVQNIEQQIIP